MYHARPLKDTATLLFGLVLDPRPIGREQKEWMLA